MSYKFSADEIREVIAAARIFNPSFSEKQYQDLLELGRHLADSGYLKAVRGLARLEKEEGITCTEALDGYEQLLSDKAEKEAELASLQEKLIAQQDKNQEAEEQYRQIKEAIEQAKEELQTVQTERQKGEKDLITFRKKAEREKERIEKEVEECRRGADVTKEEAVIAGQVKVEVESHGFGLELALGLSQEFAGYENARDELAKALKRYQTFTRYLAAINEEGEARKKAQESELNKLQSEKDRRQTEIKSLEQARSQLGNILGQLQADVAFEEELRRFYRRYCGREGLLEYLASWDGIYFVKCDNVVSTLAGSFYRPAGNAHFFTDKRPSRCPHCGLTTLLPDEKPYQAINCWPVSDPIKLQLGE